MAFCRLKDELPKTKDDVNYFYSVCPKEDNFFIWDFVMIGPPDTFFAGGIFRGQLTFSKEYPTRPPKFKFIDNIFHPNVYNDGKVCISILHEGKDVYGYEKDSERWNPSHSVNSIMMSIISMLSDPNFESPANIEASTLWRNNIEAYKNRIYKIVAKTQE